MPRPYRSGTFEPQGDRRDLSDRWVVHPCGFVQGWVLSVLLILCPPPTATDTLMRVPRPHRGSNKDRVHVGSHRVFHIDRNVQETCHVAVPFQHRPFRPIRIRGLPHNRFRISRSRRLHRLCGRSRKQNKIHYHRNKARHVGNLHSCLDQPGSVSKRGQHGRTWQPFLSAIGHQTNPAGRCA